MNVVTSFLSAAFWGLLVLSALVFVHEGGHYLAARALRVRATEFFLGLPCRWRLSRKSAKVGTEFGVTPLLLGGYTRICGMEGASDELLAPALAVVCREGRVAAEELARELGCDVDRAYGLLATLSDWGSIRPYYDPALGERPSQKTYPASFETLARDASLLTEYDRGHDFSQAGSTRAGEPCAQDVDAAELLERERARTYQGAGFLGRCAMLAAGPLVNIALAFLIVTFSLMANGVAYASNATTLGAVEEGSVAEAAGLAAGDTVVAVAGTPVETWDEMGDLLSERLGRGEDVELSYERDGQVRATTLVVPEGEEATLVGIYGTTATYHPSFLEASQATLAYAGQVATYVSRLVQPAHTMEVLDQSSSVVGISAMASEAAAGGPSSLALFAAAISMSLGFMNLLPVPPFDGGKLLIEVVQLVIRRPLPERAQAVLNYVGLAFILFVFLVVVKNDVVRLLFG